jgi:hypothetical protein
MTKRAASAPLLPPLSELPWAGSFVDKSICLQACGSGSRQFKTVRNY